AHCFDPSDDILEVRVTLGEHETNKREGKEVFAEAAEMVIHKGFTTKTYDDDVTMVKLNITLDFGRRHRHLMPICLPPPYGLDPDGERECFVSGWGNHVAGKEEDGAFSQILREVPVQIHPKSKCSRSWNGDYDTAKHLCAGDNQHDFCSGDSGGPLVCKQ
ncbi:unnamed protein product, partial [Medioppia subpectinata]